MTSYKFFSSPALVSSQPSSSSYEKSYLYMESHIECNICKELYNCAERKPVVLKCGHSICALCIPVMSKHKLCWCRKPFEEVNVNYGLLSLIQDSKEVKSIQSNQQPVKRAPEAKTLKVKPKKAKVKVAPTPAVASTPTNPAAVTTPGSVLNQLWSDILVHAPGCQLGVVKSVRDGGVATVQPGHGDRWVSSSFKPIGVPFETQVSGLVTIPPKFSGLRDLVRVVKSTDTVSSRLLGRTGRVLVCDDNQAVVDMSGAGIRTLKLQSLGKVLESSDAVTDTTSPRTGPPTSSSVAAPLSQPPNASSPRRVLGNVLGPEEDAYVQRIVDYIKRVGGAATPSSIGGSVLKPQGLPKMKLTGFLERHSEKFKLVKEGDKRIYVELVS